MIILMASAVLLRCVAAKIVLCLQMLPPYPISETGFKMAAIYAESVYCLSVYFSHIFVTGMVAKLRFFAFQ